MSNNIFPSVGLEQKLAYRNWLKNSFEWETLRMIALIKAENKCRFCGHESPHNDVHHKWYRKRWKETRQKDLIVLCRKCHKRLHELIKPAKREDFKATQTMRDAMARAFQRIRREMILPSYVKLTPAQRGVCSLCEASLDRGYVIFLINPKNLGRCEVCQECFDFYLSFFGDNPGKQSGFFSAIRKRAKEQLAA